MSQVDVLMTVFNGERFLDQTVQSVLAQTLKDWRLIVVDDCSTDSTPEILAGYAKQDSRILILKGRHEGIASAANIGLSEVRAPFLARIDADDIAMPERLATQSRYLSSHPEVVAVGSYVRLIDAENRRLRLRRAPIDPDQITNILKTRNCMCHPSSMIRTSALRSIGGYRSKFHNSLDYDLWLRLSEVGKISNQALELLLYRRHPSQVSASGNTHRQTLYSVGAAIDFFFRRYGQPNRESSIDELENDSLAECLKEIYRFDLCLADQRALNRHSIRLLRYARGLSKAARRDLTQAMLPNLSFIERVKHSLYSKFSGE